MNDTVNTSEYRQPRAFTILGVIRILVAVALSWMLIASLPLANQPLDNGLQLTFPMMLIFVFLLPSAVIGAWLIKNGRAARSLAIVTDFIVVCLVGLVAARTGVIWLMLITLPFVVEATVLIEFADERCRRRRTILWLYGLLTVATALSAVTFIPVHRQHVKEASVHGRTAVDVRRAFGEPDGQMEQKGFEQASLGKSEVFCVSVSYYPSAHGKVWFYRDGGRLTDRGMLVYFDKRDRVERIFHGYW